MTQKMTRFVMDKNSETFIVDTQTNLETLRQSDFLLCWYSLSQDMALEMPES